MDVSKTRVQKSCAYPQFKFCHSIEMECQKSEIRKFAYFSVTTGNGNRTTTIQSCCSCQENMLCEVEGAGVVSKRAAQDWFKRFSFNEGRTNLKDNARSGSGRPMQVDSDALREAVNSQHESGCKHAQIVGSDQLGKMADHHRS